MPKACDLEDVLLRSDPRRSPVSWRWVHSRGYSLRNCSKKQIFL